MNAAGGPTYWSCGGSVIRRTGALTVERAFSLFAHHAQLAVQLSKDGDGPAARYCARTALELAEAIVSADDWCCASTGIPRSASAFRDLRAFTRDLNRKS